jgi:hypothetical protein
MASLAQTLEIVMYQWKINREKFSIVEWAVPSLISMKQQQLKTSLATLP